MHECKECERLWHEYGEATREHIGLTGKRRIAHLRHDMEAESALDVMAQQAEAARSSARSAIQEHEAVAHDQTVDKLPEA